jgi:hypothetical protein
MDTQSFSLYACAYGDAGTIVAMMAGRAKAQGNAVSFQGPYGSKDFG